MGEVVGPNGERGRSPRSQRRAGRAACAGPQAAPRALPRPHGLQPAPWGLSAARADRKRAAERNWAGSSPSSAYHGGWWMDLAVFERLAGAVSDGQTAGGEGGGASLHRMESDVRRLWPPSEAPRALTNEFPSGREGMGGAWAAAPGRSPLTACRARARTAGDPDSLRCSALLA